METKGFYNAKSDGTNALTLIWQFWTVQNSILTLLKSIKQFQNLSRQYTFKEKGISQGFQTDIT